MTDHITLGPQTPRFDNPYSTAFVEHVRGRIHRECEEFPAYVYHLPRAKGEYENIARRIIVNCLIEGFPNRLNDPVMTNEWPYAVCLLNADRTQGRIEVSWCPETDALRGGIEIDAIDFKVKAAPPNAAKRMISGILSALKPKSKVLADPEDNLAPVGTADGRPPAKSDSKTTQPRPESPVTAQRVSTQPAPGQGQPRPRQQATPQSPARQAMTGTPTKPVPPGAKPAQRPPAKR